MLIKLDKKRRAKSNGLFYFLFKEKTLVKLSLSSSLKFRSCHMYTFYKCQNPFIIKMNKKASNNVKGLNKVLGYLYHLYLRKRLFQNFYC